MYPTHPVGEGEKSNLLEALKSLSVVGDVGRLIKAVREGVSQFRFLVDEDKMKVQVMRNGLGWGENVTVSSVIFSNERDFQSFLQAKAFPDGAKDLLVRSLLVQKELPFTQFTKATNYLRVEKKISHMCILW